MKTKLRERGQKLFRRLLSFMMALVFAVSLLPVNALAEEDDGGVVPDEGKSTSCVVTVTAKDGDGNLLNGASVKVGSTTATTGNDGQAQVTVDQGKTADVTVTKDGYFKDSGKVDISGDTTSFAASLDKEITYTGTVLLTQDQGNPTEGAPASYKVKAVRGDEKIEAEKVGSTNAQKLTLRKGKTYTVTIEPAAGAPENTYEAKTFEITLNENTTAKGDAWKLALKKYTLNLGEDVKVVKGEHTGNIYYGNQSVTLAFEKENSQLTGLKINNESYFEKVTNNQLKITFGTNLNAVKATEGSNAGKYVVNVIPTYTPLYDVELELDNDKGSGSITDSNGNAITKVLNGGKVKYQVTANGGYYIKSVSVNGKAVYQDDEDERNGETKFESSVETVTGNVTISAEFAAEEYHVLVNVNKGSAKAEKANVKIGDRTIKADEADDEPFIVMGDNGTLTVKPDVSNFYKLTYQILNTANEKIGEGELTGSGNELKIEQDCTVQISVVPIDYDIVYHDPLATSGNTSFNADKEDEITLATPSAVGYTFKGWSSSVKDGKVVTDSDLLATISAAEAAKLLNDGGTVDLYAVYELNPVVVSGKGAKANSGEEVTASTAGEKAQQWDNVWFGSDVDVYGTSVLGAVLHYEYGDESKDVEVIQDEDTGKNETKLLTVRAENGAVTTEPEVVVSATKTFTDEDNHIMYAYTTSKDTEVTVQRDLAIPTLKVSRGFLSKKYKLTPADQENGSGIASVAYASVNVSDIRKTVEDKNLQSFLLSEDVTWKDIAADEKDNYVSDVKQDNADKMLIFRTVDQAGNIGYCPADSSNSDLFDTTVPEISVSYAYTDNGGDHEDIPAVSGEEGAAKKKSVYAKDKITVKVTITDAHLVFDYNKDEAEGSAFEAEYYNGCKVRLTAADGTDILLTPKEGTIAFETGKGDKKDTWTAEYTIPVSDAYNDKALTLTVDAVDQMGNEASPFTSDVLRIETDTSAPNVGVTYTDTDGRIAAQNKEQNCNEGDYLYAKDYTATITVMGSTFAPYVDTDENAASVAVYDNGDEIPAENITWNTRGKDTWVGTCPLSETEGEHILTVTATSQSGVSKTYTSGKLYVDTATEENPEPKIDVSYDGVVYDNNGKYYNGNNDTITATITITDDNYASYAGNAGEEAALSNYFEKNVTLSGGIITESEQTKDVKWEQNKDGTGITGTVTLPYHDIDAIDATYTLTVNAKDKAGNKNAYTYDKLHDDKTASGAADLTKAEILEIDEGNAFLNALTFGNFFNREVKLVITMQDADSNTSWSSGLKQITLVSCEPGIDPNAEEAVVYTVDSEDFTVNTDDDGNATGTVTATFTLPLDELIQTAENGTKEWKADLYVKSTDNVDNVSEAFAIASAENDIIESSTVLYETVAPTVSCNYQDEAVSYHDTAKGEDSEDYVVLKGQPVTIKISDKDNANGTTNADETINDGTTNASGLHTAVVELANAEGSHVAYFKSKDNTVGYDEKTNNYYQLSEDEMAETAVFDDTFVVDYDVLQAGTNVITVTVTDNAGNETIESYTFYKDETAPTATIALKDTDDAKDEADYTCKAHDEPLKWYNSYNIEVTVAVTENGTYKSGLKEVTVTVNGNNETLPVSETEFAAGTMEKSYTFNLSDYEELMKEGKNTIEVSVTDKVGNTSTVSEDVYVDTTAPTITKFTFTGTNGLDGKGDVSKDPNIVNDKDQYAYYFQTDTNVLVNVSDETPSAGVKHVVWKTIDVNGTESEPAQAVVNTTTCSTSESIKTDATFTVRAGFKGWVYAYVVDNVGNYPADPDHVGTFTWANPDGTILETPGQHQSEKDHITFSAPTPVTRLEDGNGLYNKNTPVTITVKDTYSGIRAIQYEITTENPAPGSLPKTATYEGLTAGNAKDNGWNAVTTEKNLLTKASKTLDIDYNSNNIEITVTMWDNSGNTSTEKYKLHIDKDAPEITVSFDPADGGDDPVHTGYFKTNRTMTVTIIERNFDAGKVKISSTKNGGGYSPYGGFSKGAATTSKSGAIAYTWTMTYTFQEDGDYTFGIEATDKASNRTTDEQVNYGSAAAKTVAKKFTIDKTKPVINVDISGQRGKDIYYKGAVTITVAVNEHNYDPNRYTLAFVLKDSQTGATVSVSPPSDSVSNSGDMWYHRYVCSQEFIYQITSVVVIDKAGNETNTYGGSYSGGPFVVDNTDPNFNLFTNTDKNKDLEHTATKDRAAPVIVIHDTNLDTTDSSSYTVTLTGIMNGTYGNVASGRNYGYNVVATDNRTLEVRFNDFAKKEQVDDIYTLTVNATDKAGRTSSKSAMFSVNRYGSTYMVSGTTKDLVDRYYTNAEQDVEVIQINAAPITNQSVAVSRNNVSTTLTKDTDYTMKYTEPGYDSTSKTKNTASGWYECRYTIGKKQFTEEGIYDINIFSSDSAENSLSNKATKRTIASIVTTANRNDSAVLSQDKSLEAPVNFLVDKTAPTAEHDELRKQYFSGSHTFSIYCDDDVMIDYAEVSVNGEKQTFTAEELKNSAKVELGTANGFNQEIVVTAYDMAGNSYSTEMVKVQVTRDPIKLYINNRIAHIVTVVLVLGAIIFIVMRRRKVDEEEEA